MLATYPPRNAPMRPGDRFVIRTGKRRLLFAGDHSYFQKDQRRYFCTVLGVRHERYLDRWRRPEMRCVCEVEIISH